VTCLVALPSISAADLGTTGSCPFMTQEEKIKALREKRRSTRLVPERSYSGGGSIAYLFLPGGNRKIVCFKTGVVSVTYG
jgi:hypothetical protein